MNIFFLDIRPEMAARYHCDKHVVKMIIESAQLLCIAHRVLDPLTPEQDAILYRKTHVNHPCAIWVRQSTQSYYWVYELMMELHKEFLRRSKKQEEHETIIKLGTILATPPKNLPDIGWVMPPKCMPEKFHKYPVVDAYREYFKECKRNIAYWTATPTPDWYE